jgi:hypothetical protein
VGCVPEVEKIAEETPVNRTHKQDRVKEAFGDLGGQDQSVGQQVF